MSNKNSDGSITTKISDSEGRIVKEITIPAKDINIVAHAQPKRKEGINVEDIPEEFKAIPEHRAIMTRESKEERIQAVAKGKHRIKPGKGREIKVRDNTPADPNEWLNNLGKILSDPNSLNEMTSYFDKITEGSGAGFKEMWEKQKNTMGDMDDIIQESSDFLDKTLSEGSVINGLFIVKNYMEKLIVLLSAAENFLDMEICASPNYEEVRSPYGRAVLNTQDSIREIEQLIENVIIEKKRLENSEVKIKEKDEQ